nr:MAG TPA: hypothetical protein [Caudoviricetes sp.]
MSSKASVRLIFFSKLIIASVNCSLSIYVTLHPSRTFVRYFSG